jgi:hypothetical protein
LNFCRDLCGKSFAQETEDVFRCNFASFASKGTDEFPLVHAVLPTNPSSKKKDLSERWIPRSSRGMTRETGRFFSLRPLRLGGTGL